MNEAVVIWDLDDEPDGNVQHVRAHDLTIEEVEDVLLEAANPTSESRSSGETVTFGWTRTGRHIIVVWEHVQGDPLTIRPITAYEVPPPREKR